MVCCPTVRSRSLPLGLAVAAITVLLGLGGAEVAVRVMQRLPRLTAATCA
jgi:hypothetical protein